MVRAPWSHRSLMRDCLSIHLLTGFLGVQLFSSLRLFSHSNSRPWLSVPHRGRASANLARKKRCECLSTLYRIIPEPWLPFRPTATGRLRGLAQAGCPPMMHSRPQAVRAPVLASFGESLHVIPSPSVPCRPRPDQQSRGERVRERESRIERS